MLSHAQEILQTTSKGEEDSALGSSLRLCPIPFLPAHPGEMEKYRSQL